MSIGGVPTSTPVYKLTVTDIIDIRFFDEKWRKGSFRTTHHPITLPLFHEDIQLVADCTDFLSDLVHLFHDF